MKNKKTAFKLSLHTLLNTIFTNNNSCQGFHYNIPLLNDMDYDYVPKK